MINVQQLSRRILIKHHGASPPLITTFLNLHHGSVRRGYTHMNDRRTTTTILTDNDNENYDINNNNNNKQYTRSDERARRENPNFHWSEFEYEFKQKKKNDWEKIALFACPIILLCYNALQLLRSLSESDNELCQNTYDDLVRLFKQALLKEEEEASRSGSKLSEEQLMKIGYCLRKLIHNVLLNYHSRSALGEDSELIECLTRLSNTVIDSHVENSQNEKSDAHTVYYQYILEHIFQLTSIISANQVRMSDQSSHLLLDSCLKSIASYSTIPQFSKMNPFVYSLLTMHELLRGNESLVKYFLKNKGMERLEEFIRKRRELELVIEDNLQKADAEAKHLLEMRSRTQQEVSKEKTQELVDISKDVNTKAYEERMCILMVLSLIASHPEAKMKDSFPCVKFLVTNLGEGSLYGSSLAAEVLLKLGVPSDPKQRKPQFGSQQLNLLLFNGTGKDINCNAELEKLKFRASFLNMSASELDAQLQKLLKMSEGTYVEHSVRALLLRNGQVEQIEEEYEKAYHHPSGYGATDIDLLISKVEIALALNHLSDVFKYLRQLQGIAPKHPVVSQVIFDICEANQELVLRDAAIRSAIFSLDQYDACYKVKALLRAKK